MKRTFAIGVSALLFVLSGCGEVSRTPEENSCKRLNSDIGWQTAMPDAEGTNEQCSNGVNDFHTVDKQGNESNWFDCNNNQCNHSALVTVCDALENTEQACSDGIDNANGSGLHADFRSRANGLIDCEDPSCFKNPMINQAVCPGQMPRYELGADCHDGIDNDGDGFADCDDLDCLHANASCCDLGDRKRVLFDNSHHQVAGAVDWIIDVTGRHPFPTFPLTEDKWHGSLSAFGRDLITSRNYVVETLIQNRSFTYGDSEQVQDLSNYNILVIAEPSSSFKSEEIRAVEQFIRNGGGVLFVTDHAGADRDANGVDSVIAVNQFLKGLSNAQTLESNPLGFYILDGTMQTTTAGVSENAVDHPIINGKAGKVSTTGVYGGARIQCTNSNAQPILDAVDDHQTFVVASSLDNGRVVVIGDSSIIGDGTNYLGLTLSKENGYIDTKYQNRELILNAIDWLAKL